MPRRFALCPEKLTKFTRELQRSELLKPVIPEVFVPNLESLADGFVEYIQEMPPGDLDARRASPKTYHVHTGKLPGSEFISFLQSTGLAGRFAYPWLRMEVNTANDYMAYLASCIAQVHDSHPRALTNDIANCSPLLSPRDRTDLEVQDVRSELLRAAFPAPSRRLTVEELQIFKKRHGSLLPDFRFWIEERVAAIADSKTPEIRSKRLEDTKEQITAKKGEIAESLEGSGFGKLVFGDLCSILGAIPYIKILPNLVNKIYKVTHVAPKSGPLAYAAFAERKLGTK